MNTTKEGQVSGSETPWPAIRLEEFGSSQEILCEKIFELKLFWQWSLLHEHVNITSEEHAS